MAMKVIDIYKMKQIQQQQGIERYAHASTNTNTHIHTRVNEHQKGIHVY